MPTYTLNYRSVCVWPNNLQKNCALTKFGYTHLHSHKHTGWVVDRKLPAQNKLFINYQNISCDLGGGSGPTWTLSDGWEV